MALVGHAGAAGFPHVRGLALRALDLDPNNAWAWLRLGWAAVYLGRAAEGLRKFDPAEALVLIEKGLRAAPKAHWAYRMLCGTLWLMGERARAIEAGRHWRPAHPGLSTRTLIEGLPSWDHDPEYLAVLREF